jgi:3'-phosphoadenosine 5'-phosphosulfate sulfotransferase (PAPS reductase)/FAD synthetase
MDLQKYGIQATGLDSINQKIECVVPLSGGKDSQACLMLALQKFNPENVIALFCDTGFEHPETYAHVLKTAKENNVCLVTLSAGTVIAAVVIMLVMGVAWVAGQLVKGCKAVDRRIDRILEGCL